MSEQRMGAKREAEALRRKVAVEERREGRTGKTGTREKEAGVEERGNKTDNMAEGMAEAVERRSTKEDEETTG